MDPTFVVAVSIVAALLIMIPKSVWKHVLGYVFLFDFTLSYYAITTGVATGTVTGMAAGFLAAVMFSIVLRVIREFVGANGVTIDGDGSYSTIFAALMTQGAAWARAIFFGLLRGGKIEKPAPINWEWKETRSPFQGVRSFWSTLRAQFAGA
jgi:hypothetical protein